MPVHPAVAATLAQLDGLPSWRETMADPALRPRLDGFRFWPPAATLPAVDTKEDAAPGPHGPVPVRIYQGASEPRRPALVWIHGGGFVHGDLDMAEADWTAREVAARAGAVVDDGWLPARLVPVYATLHAAVPPLSPSLAAALAELPRPVRAMPEDHS